MKVKDLKGNKENPRTITKEKLAMLSKSLKEFGDLSGIIYNRKTKRLVGGHQRTLLLPKDAEIVLIAKHAKPTKVGTVAEGFVMIGQEKFNYREVLWDETREKAANIAANKGAGEWDIEQLSAWMIDLDSMGFDLDLTMFESLEREDLLTPTVKPNKNPESVTDSEQFIISIHCKNESEMQELYEELEERGLNCKLIT